jgi:putative transposase
MTPKKGSSDLRKGRHSAENFIYHITFATQDRIKTFSNDVQARLMVKALKYSDAKACTETLAFVVMPDHIHWLLVLKSGDLPRCVARVKSYFSRLSGLKVWQDGFYDHAIRSDESLINVARYIVANPLRAGLVEGVGDYPYWDSRWLE